MLHRSVLKRERQNRKRRLRNRKVKAKLKAITKQIKASSSSEKLEKLLKEAYKSIDQASAKGVIHKNKASRMKSRLAKKINQNLQVVRKQKV